jgi:hypothetical protein
MNHGRDAHATAEFRRCAVKTEHRPDAGGEVGAWIHSFPRQV